MGDKNKMIMLIDNCTRLVYSKQNDTEWMANVDIESKKLLDILLKDLKNMKIFLNPKVYMPVYSRLIIEYWDEFSDIGNELLKASQEYEKLT